MPAEFVDLPASEIRILGDEMNQLIQKVKEGNVTLADRQRMNEIRAALTGNPVPIPPEGEVLPLEDEDGSQ